MKTLNKNKPFATIMPPDAGRFFEQDGEFYRMDGTLWSAEPLSEQAPSTDAPAGPGQAEDFTPPAGQAPA